MTDKAKALRKRSTDAERALWRRLRDRQLGDAKIRRQHQIGPYVVDFVCLDRHLVIEVDGGQHDVNRAKDAKRTTWLNGEGFRVIRFWNNEVSANIDGVLAVIDRELGKG